MILPVAGTRVFHLAFCSFFFWSSDRGSDGMESTSCPEWAQLHLLWSCTGLRIVFSVVLYMQALADMQCASMTIQCVCSVIWLWVHSLFLFLARVVVVGWGGGGGWNMKFLVITPMEWGMKLKKVKPMWVYVCQDYFIHGFDAIVNIIIIIKMLFTALNLPH